MKFLTALLLTALLSFVGGLYAPWWSLALMSFLVAVLVAQRPGKAFLAGFLALFLLWGCVALWLDVRNKGLLSARIGELLGLGSSSILLILVTALIGGLVAGFAALTGSYLRSPKRTTSFR
ncbi:hypothetical protein LZZ85_20355 [Terrimonas sp. NA20]|uniref:Uncharacterized protein n=1 Tax=Terrimonas ginsenosidimutans TaxID=2908004 RepID=A0ABS9KWJ9_9BACT|nr:hypothetical protein [Terrimonas ginsenosidimutans]MCG2616663.1 hypothetical protein [Terrimonas ginsenosidimutans]